MNIVDNWFIEIDNKIENSDASGDLCFSMGTVELPKRRCIGSSCDHIFSRSSSGRICILNASGWRWLLGISSTWIASCIRINYMMHIRVLYYSGSAGYLCVHLV